MKGLEVLLVGEDADVVTRRRHCVQVAMRSIADRRAGRPEPLRGES